MRPLFLAGVLVALCTAAHADSTRAFRKRTVQDREVLITFHEHHNAHCQADLDPAITVTARPAHGRVEVRTEMRKPAEAPTFGIINCIGQPIRAQAIWYLPDAGFVGSDSFTYDRRLPEDLLHATVTIDVRPPP